VLWLVAILSSARHEKSGVKLGGPPSKAKTTPVSPIVDEYREGQVKSTPVRGVKESLKPHAYKR
jgi:hypothetical protein